MTDNWLLLLVKKIVIFKWTRAKKCHLLNTSCLLKCNQKLEERPNKNESSHEKKQLFVFRVIFCCGVTA